MKAIPSTITKGLINESRIVCADNSGAKELRIVGVKGYKGRKKRNPSAGVGDVVMASVSKGNPVTRKTKVYAVVVRQKKEFKRADGTRVKFNDNAAVVVTEDGVPKGTEIKGAIAKEAATRWPKIAGIASNVI